MNLKLDRVEVENFKSYHGKHTIGPFMAFTSVIGPNGCGKSNMMDAISFVLGEKASNLRVNTLAGVIHNCDSKLDEIKSIVNCAIVTAYFVNALETLIYKRIVYREGRCEYYINDEIVTANSYIEALEELGIVVKAQNFLVFQGGIELITLQNPKDRSRMFDRISGSYKLKDRYQMLKDQFQKQLDYAHQMISRKRGIVAEKNQAKYEKQEAQKYQKHIDTLKEMNLELYLYKLYHVDYEINIQKEDLKSFQEKIEDINIQLEKLSHEISTNKEAYIDCSKKQSNLFSELNIKRDEFDKIQSEMYELEQKSSNLKGLLEDLNSKLEELNQTRIANDNECILLEKELLYNKNSRDNYNDEYFVKKSILPSYSRCADDEYQNLIETYKKSNATELEELERLTGILTVVEKNYSSIEQKICFNKKLITQLETKINNINVKIQKLNEFLSEATLKSKSLEVAIEEKRGLLGENSMKLLRYKQELNIINEEILNAKFEINENLHYEHYFEITTTLKMNFSGVIGRFIDLCHPVHKKYSIPITKVTYKYMDAFIVDTEETGRNCIQFLKDRHEPPCLFLPLDSIVVPSINEKLRDLGGTAKLLIDVFKYELPQMKKIIDFVCGNTVVCDTLEEAKKIAFHSQRERRKVVTLEGTLFLKSGIISGGTLEISGKATKWDKKNLLSLKAKRDMLTSKIHDLERSNIQNDLQSLVSELSTLKNRINATNQQLQECDALIVSDMKSQLAASHEEIMTELHDISNERDKIQPQLDQISSSLKSAKDQFFSEFIKSYNYNSIDDFEKAYVVCRSQIDAQKLKYDIEIEKLESKLDCIKKSDIPQKIQSYIDNITQKQAQLQKIDEQLSDNKIKHLEEKNDVELKEKYINELSERKKNLDILLRKLTSENIQRREELENYKKKLSKLVNRLTELQTVRRHIIRNAKIENISLPFLLVDDENEENESYSLIFDKTLPIDPTTNCITVSPKINYSHLSDNLKLDNRNHVEKNQLELKLKNKIDNFKKEISRLNAPNMKSFERLEEIMNKIKSTDDELEKCRENVRKAKLEFEICRKERTKLFMSTFDGIAKSIDEIYKLLTGSPNAEAYLSVDLIDEPYHGNVNFNSIAPGKRYRPMDNLSGGEKSIAALALLFAINQYKPSPFFILDEIDAALDNSNIEKVANFIRQKSKTENMQFVVISLKEDLYSASDAIIGVTAQTDSNHMKSCLFTLELSNF